MSGHTAHSLTLPAPFPAAAASLLMHFKSCTRLDRRRLTRPRNGQLNGQSACRPRRRPCRSCRHNKNVLGAGSRSRCEAGTACGKDKCTTNSCTSVAHFNKVNCILALCVAAREVAEGGDNGKWNGSNAASVPRFLSSHLLLALFIIVRFAFDNVCDVLVIVLLSCLFTNCVVPPPTLPTPTPVPLSLHVQLIIIYFNELPNRISNVAAQTATRLRSDSSLKKKLSLFKQEKLQEMRLKNQFWNFP